MNLRGLLLIATLIILTGCGPNSTPGQAASGPAGPTPSATRAQFEQVGYFKSDAMRGFTYYVQHPSEESIRTFCQEQKTQYGRDRILKIHFYDNRQMTPDVTLEYNFPESSDSALVADYFSNPNNGQEELQFHKEIPALPRAAGG